jgi:GT2 family glycosyltransferase
VTTDGRSPKVRVVVVNYNGGATTMRTLDALGRLTWPAEALEIVLVDNASGDGIVGQVRRDLPWIRVIESATNVGFAGGCNLALRDLDGVDHVALLNNDAVPSPDWLTPLADALAADPDIAAANAKILFSPAFVTLTVECPIGADVDLTALEIDGRDAWSDAQFRQGCESTATRGTGGAHRCSLREHAVIRVPTDPGGALPPSVTVGLTSTRSGRVRLHAGGAVVDADTSATEVRVSVPLGGPRYDVINNAGNRLVAGGYGADRGFLEEDRGQYDEMDEVFAWCGAAVLLSVRSLRDVGVFDPSYFMYYEDTDLAWRSRLRGWRHVYVPTSVVRHEHSASSVEGSELHDYHVERNRLLTLARNAPWPMVLAASWRSLRHVGGASVRELLVPAVRGRRGSGTRAARQGRAFGGYVRKLPAVLVARQRQRVTNHERTVLADRWVS